MISPLQSAEQLSKSERERRAADGFAFFDPSRKGTPELVPSSGVSRHADEYDEASTLNPDNVTLLAGPNAPREPPSVGRFAPGQMIAGRFTVVRYIARGGMGEVYEVEDLFLQGVHVALKVILPEIAGDSGSSRRFEQEVLLARKVTHANLCPIYDIARCDEPAPAFLFLTMKLLSGETLSARLRRPEAIPREEAIAIFRQMVAGVAAIHAAGVIHRDIKPNNVMLDYSGPEVCASIMDFGLARLHEQETTMTTRSVVAGTPGYLAPEILRGQGPSQAADLFALGVLLHQVFTRERPRVGALTATVEPSPALEKADVPPALIHAVREFLSNDPDRRCVAFEAAQTSLASGRSLTFREADSRAKLLSRRRFAIGSAVAALAAAGGVAWEWDRFYDLLHPLPAKRFVALLNWPPPDASVKPMVLGVIDAIASELARAEAFDRNLLVIAPQHTARDLTTTAQLNEARESLGANLVLATSAKPRGGELHLSLSVLDSSSTIPLRTRQVRIPLSQPETLPEKAVRAAAELLGIAGYKPDDQRSSVGTGSTQAYAAFLDAEALRQQDNDTGLDAAIEKYKQAIDIDPRYAVAQARLAWAYLRSYGLHRDPAALTIAGLNCKSAIRLDPGLVDAHVGLASVYRQTGDEEGSSQEMLKALSLDPSNPHTLIYQADFYAADNRWDEAEATFNRVLSLRPNYWLAHNEWGAVLEDEGKYPQALVEVRSASLAAPKNALALKNVGSVNLRLGRMPEAFQYLNASYQMKPDDGSAIALAEAYRLQHKYAEAIDFAKRATRLNPDEPGHWLELGDVYLTAGRYSVEADTAYKQAAATEERKLLTSPKDGPGWMLLALCCAKTGEPDRALTLIAKAESLHADDMDSQFYKARTLELAGRRDDALATVARCLRRGPTLFQLQSMPDLEKLQTTPAFKSMAASATSSGAMPLKS